jgi:Ca2+-binding EF-hand superfamily protein
VSLVYFLEKNGFKAQREDIEAILRRIDHDGNQRITLDEFSELCCINSSTGENKDDTDID